MSESSKMNFHELMSLYKGYNDTIDALYRLRTTNEEILDKICNDIKNNLIDTKYLLPSYILDTISFASRCNNRYLKSYWYIFKKIYEEYRPDHINDFLYGFDYFVYKEYGIWLNEENKISPERIESENFSLEVVKSDTIFESIMNDNIETFTSFTEREEFDKNEVLVSPFFIDTTKPSLLEVCCYYGATKCFSLLREKFNSEITKRCLQFSILNGNFGLVKECLKAIEPDKECMEYAILSHNIALVTFFMIEYKLTIEVFRCGEYHNLQAFFVYLDQTNDIKKCFIYSPVFNIPSLCKYFLSQGANIYDRSPTNKQTALHIAAYLNAVESAKFLITNDAAINKKNIDGNTPLLIAAEYNSKEMIELLIQNEANIFDRNNDKKTALYLAAENDASDAAETLIVHGANVNDSYNYGETVLHIAAELNNENIVSVLVSHGAIINAKEYKNESTALHKVSMKGNTSIVKILLSHGADVNAIDSYRKTALDYAKENGNEEIEKLLISHGAISNSLDN